MRPAAAGAALLRFFLRLPVYISSSYEPSESESESEFKPSPAAVATEPPRSLPLPLPLPPPLPRLLPKRGTAGSGAPSLADARGEEGEEDGPMGGGGGA